MAALFFNLKFLEMKNNNIIILLVLLSYTLSGQNVTDVVRWSSNDFTGTARTLGVGSSFGAMGGDFSGININPAGIADYRVSEFTFTPSLNKTSTNSFYNADPNNISPYNKSSFGLDNLGFVIAGNPNSSWTSSNVAIGFSRVANLSRNISIKGATPGSITTMFAELANGKTVDQLDDFVAFPAYNVGAIFDFDNDNQYSTDFNPSDVTVDKSQTINQKGGINELTLGWAGEYKHKLNLGISMAVPFASFEETKIYSETDRNDNIATFNELEYVERLSTSGVGFNLKAGFVYKITPKVRFGGAFHSPTWYRFTDDYSNSINYSFYDGTNQSYSYDSPDGTFNYRINNPWRAVGSAGTIYKLGQIVGFLNGDIEFVDYTTASYKGISNVTDVEEIKYTREVNEQILTKLGSATNIRLGTELAYQNLRLRLGYSWEQSAFNADDFYNNKFSFGIGFREDDFFIDLGFRISDQAEGYNAYVVTDAALDPLANIDSHRMKSALTVGIKF